MPHLALRFISGKYEGGEFPLRDEREIVIGRGSDLDMVLVEDMVSRKHAKISTVGGQVVIKDLGSTNGTFVNGEKIKKAPLQEGDRILIGTSIIKLVAMEHDGAGADHAEAEARARLESEAMRREQGAAQSRPMTGSIEEIPLPDLLQLLSTSRKTGVLVVRSDRGLGKIHLRKGKVFFASIDDNLALPPHKAFYRMLTWARGNFELAPPEERQVIEEMRDSTEGLLIDGMRQLDEVRRLEADLPPPGSRLAVPTPLSARLRDLSGEQLDVFQLVLDRGSLEAVLDSFPGTDLEAYTHLLELLRRELVVVT